MAVITEEPSLFRLEHDGESADELESNFFLPSEGLPTGFGVSTEMAEGVACDSIRYRGIAYALVLLTGREMDEVWHDYLSDDPG